VDRNLILDRIWQASESEELIPTCSWCGRVCIDGEWVEPTHGSLDTIDQPMTLSHSICPTCAESGAAARFANPN
jgi:hypothetical protein